VTQHRKFFRRKPRYIRPFLARSDPALLSGFVANVLANKVALSEIYAFGKKHDVPVYPIIGAGSFIFRGGLSPARCKKFVAEYGGVRTVTVQSAFRYDHPRSEVKKAIAYLNGKLPKSRVSRIDREDRLALSRIIKIFSKAYQSVLAGLLHDLAPFFDAVPKRRERRQHTGLLAYGRHMGKSVLPRAISFSAALYSLGIPPEFIGIGRALGKLNEREKKLLMKHYKYFKDDLIDAGRYINRENIDRLARSNVAWRLVAEDIQLAERYLGARLGPRNNAELLHRNLASQLFLRRASKAEMSRLIVETGKLRGGLG
jgi:phosphoenolpyruvate carboxylase